MELCKNYRNNFAPLPVLAIHESMKQMKSSLIYFRSEHYNSFSILFLVSETSRAGPILKYLKFLNEVCLQSMSILPSSDELYFADGSQPLSFSSLILHVLSGSISRIMVAIKLALGKKKIHLCLPEQSFWSRVLYSESCSKRTIIQFLEYPGFRTNAWVQGSHSSGWAEDECYQVQGLVSDES